MTDRILCVDDDPEVLAGMQRVLRKQFDADTAVGGQEGLAAIGRNGPYAVVVSDYRMPGMDGIEFLSRVREISPDTVRLMLTGHAHLDVTMAAVNEGNIFRFLTKPVQADELAKALEAAVRQYRLITAERELLEKTLHGSIKLLTDVLALVNPLAFSQASRLKRYVRCIATELGLQDVWQFELAAMLSQIGCVTLPHETLEKLYSGQELSVAEANAFAAHPAAGRDLLANIPRLEPVAQMIARQQDPINRNAALGNPPSRDRVALGAQILKVALAFDQLVAHGASPRAALAQIRKRSEDCEPAMITALEKLELSPVSTEARCVKLNELTIGMILNQDVHARNGLLLVTKGQEVTFPVL